MIGDMLPGCGIEDKHVRSKLSVWRRTHTAIVTILAVSGGGGFTFDDDNHILMANKPKAWSEQEKVYKEGVKLVRGKAFPWLERWNVLFGTDRATGNSANDVGDTYNDLQQASIQAGNNHWRGHKGSNAPRSEDHEALDDKGDNAISFNPPSDDGGSSKKSSGKHRRSGNLDSSQIKDLMHELMESAQVTLNSSVSHFAPTSSSSSQQPLNDIAPMQD